MTIQSNLDAAIVDLKVELDGMSFLNPGEKALVDQELIDAVGDDMATLIADYDAVFEGVWDGEAVEPTAEMLAHWLFDGGSHQLSMLLSPSNTEKSLYFRTPVPLPWR